MSDSTMLVSERRLRIAVLYPTLLNLYGDRGNARALQRRCELRGIATELRQVEIGDAWSPEDADIVLVGGGQDREQRRVEADLQQRGDLLRQYVANEGVALAVCGGFQLFGHHYRGYDGEIMRGIGVFDAVATHPGPQVARCVGNVVVLWEGETVVGFENHGGRTYLNEDQAAFGQVISGFGNNGGDGLEGARVGNAFGTYLHGAVLPKNPHLADRLIALALERQYGVEAAQLEPIDDRAALRAHASALHMTLADRSPSLLRLCT